MEASNTGAGAGDRGGIGTTANTDGGVDTDLSGDDETVATGTLTHETGGGTGVGDAMGAYDTGGGDQGGTATEGMYGSPAASTGTATDTAGQGSPQTTDASA